MAGPVTPLRGGAIYFAAAMQAKALTQDEARRIAANIARCRNYCGRRKRSKADWSDLI
jgi:hypothetical protein